jgi:uncharacterized membrane protein HdeD (DUF308 family)
MAEARQQVQDAVAEVEGQIAAHWVWYLILGVLLLVGGVAAIAFPFVSTITAKIALGWIFLASSRLCTRCRRAIGAASFGIC